MKAYVQYSILENMVNSRKNAWYLTRSFPDKRVKRVTSPLQIAALLCLGAMNGVAWCDPPNICSTSIAVCFMRLFVLCGCSFGWSTCLCGRCCFIAWSMDRLVDVSIAWFIDGLLPCVCFQLGTTLAWMCGRSIECRSSSTTATCTASDRGSSISGEPAGVLTTVLTVGLTLAVSFMGLDRFSCARGT